MNYITLCIWPKQNATICFIGFPSAVIGKHISEF